MTCAVGQALLQEQQALRGRLWLWSVGLQKQLGLEEGHQIAVHAMAKEEQVHAVLAIAPWQLASWSALTPLW